MAKLYLGTRRYSSWSLRGWLLVRLAGLPAEEIFVRLEGGHSKDVKEVSPSGMVPYLEHDGARIWESLAIAEYCAEMAPALWPEERVARAHARAIAAEMHAGFRALRLAMPMNLGRDYRGLGQTPESLADIARIEALWTETRQAFGAGGPYLFGATLQRGGRHVCAGGGAAAWLPAAFGRGGPGLLRGGAPASADGGMV